MTKFSSYILGFFKQGAALQTLFRVPQPPFSRVPLQFLHHPLLGARPQAPFCPFLRREDFEPLVKGRL